MRSVEKAVHPSPRMLGMAASHPQCAAQQCAKTPASPGSGRSPCLSGNEAPLRALRPLAAAARGLPVFSGLRAHDVDVHVLDLKVLQSILDAAARARPVRPAHMRLGIPKFYAIGIALADRVLACPYALWRRVRTARLRPSTRGGGWQIWIRCRRRSGRRVASRRRCISRPADCAGEPDWAGEVELGAGACRSREGGNTSVLRGAAGLGAGVDTPAAPGPAAPGVAARAPGAVGAAAPGDEAAPPAGAPPVCANAPPVNRQKLTANKNLCMRASLHGQTIIGKPSIVGKPSIGERTAIQPVPATCHSCEVLGRFGLLPALQAPFAWHEAGAWA